MNPLCYRLCHLGSAAVSDALDSFRIDGGIVGVAARVPGTATCGPAFNVRYEVLVEERGAGFRQAGNYIDDVPPGAVIVVDNAARADATTWGNILTETARLRGVAGTVVYGASRDVGRIRELGYPLYTSHVFMQSGKNRVVKVAQQIPVTLAGRTINPGDLVVADDDGVVIVPEALGTAVASRAEATVATEERILAAVRAGTPLASAREAQGYATPWRAMK